MIKRHTRPNPAKQIKGGIAERESPIAVSNVMIVCPQCGPVRIAHHVETLPGGKVRRTRVCRKCGQRWTRNEDKAKCRTAKSGWLPSVF